MSIFQTRVPVEKQRTKYRVTNKLLTRVYRNTRFAIVDTFFNFLHRRVEIEFFFFDIQISTYLVPKYKIYTIPKYYIYIYIIDKLTR